MVQSAAVLEVCGGLHSPWIAVDKRERLAEIVTQALRLQVRPHGLHITSDDCSMWIFRPFLMSKLDARTVLHARLVCDLTGLK